MSTYALLSSNIFFNDDKAAIISNGEISCHCKVWFLKLWARFTTFNEKVTKLNTVSENAAA